MTIKLEKIEVAFINYEFLLQTERTHKLVKYLRKIDDFITGHHELIDIVFMCPFFFFLLAKIVIFSCDDRYNTRMTRKKK